MILAICTKSANSSDGQVGKASRCLHYCYNVVLNGAGDYTAAAVLVRFYSKNAHNFILSPEDFVLSRLKTSKILIARVVRQTIVFHIRFHGVYTQVHTNY